MRHFEGDRGGEWEFDENSPLGPPGGFGAVYAGQGNDGASVAVKVIKKIGMYGELPTLLFKREADIAEVLRDVPADHLIKVLDVADLDDDLVLVLERAESALVDKARTALTQDEAVAILLDVVRGLEELHRGGIIHRDLKPGNILWHEGKWKLSDFGMARDSSIGTGHQTFVGGGTPAYMAPELFTGSPSVLTDLYALGCLAYQLLTGKLPIELISGDDWASAHATQPIPPIPGEVNPSLKALIVRLLGKDPAVRPEDARAVRERLERLVLPLTPLQQTVQQLEAEHEEERARRDAELAAFEAQTTAFAQTQHRGRLDLRDVCEEAIVLLQQASPDVRFAPGKQENIFMFESDHGDLDIILWPEGVAPWAATAPHEVFALGGEVRGENKRPSGRHLLANVVYEQEEGRYIWFLYRFTAGPVRDYYPGPRDRPHGFEPSYFLKDRTYMRQSVMHIWNLSREVLTAERLVGLYAEVLGLPPRR